MQMENKKQSEVNGLLENDYVLRRKQQQQSKLIIQAKSLEKSAQVK